MEILSSTSVEPKQTIKSLNIYSCIFASTLDETKCKKDTLPSHLVVDLAAVPKYCSLSIVIGSVSSPMTDPSAIAEMIKDATPQISRVLQFFAILLQPCKYMIQLVCKAILSSF